MKRKAKRPVRSRCTTIKPHGFESMGLSQQNRSGPASKLCLTDRFDGRIGATLDGGTGVSPVFLDTTTGETPIPPIRQTQPRSNQHNTVRRIRRPVRSTRAPRTAPPDRVCLWCRRRPSRSRGALGPPDHGERSVNQNVDSTAPRQATSPLGPPIEPRLNDWLAPLWLAL